MSPFLHPRQSIDYDRLHESERTRGKTMLGGIEAGGTKFVCGIGTSPEDFTVVSFPTAQLDDCVRQSIEFFREKAGANLSAVGIASFGPIDLDPGSRTYGHITTTPKLEWRDYDIVGAIARALAVPVAFDTDVNAAALAEAQWGAARDVEDSLYITVGTGIGGGAVIGGRVIHGLMHPEMGHIRVPHDWKDDPFTGGCPIALKSGMASTVCTNRKPFLVSLNL
jgi:fructokinase